MHKSIKKQPFFLHFFNSIHRRLLSFFNDLKKTVSKWLTSCERKEKNVSIDPTPSHDPLDEYIKLKVNSWNFGYVSFCVTWLLKFLYFFNNQSLREELDDGEKTYETTVELNQQLLADNVSFGWRFVSNEKEMQAFATRLSALRKRHNDKKDVLYILLLNLSQTKLDDVDKNTAEFEKEIEFITMSDKYPHVEYDFQNVKVH